MPIRVEENLPATKILRDENIFFMTKDRAAHQDIRPLEIVILNLMPLKSQTERHLLRLLSNSPLQLNITLLEMATHTSKNTPLAHMDAFYTTFDQIKKHKYDGMIITGAPIEQMPFEQVTYWPELKEIMAWTRTNVTSTFHICWGAQAGLYYHYGIDKHPLDKKMFGVFKHKIVASHSPLLRGINDEFYAPHSRHTGIDLAKIMANEALELMAKSEEAGVYIVKSQDNKQIFVTGHSEYEADTLKEEYLRDLEKGLKIDPPKNYFNQGDITLPPIAIWRSHAHLLYSNWLNYYVYQVTPYKLEEGEKE